VAVTDLVALAVGWMLVALGVASSGAWVLRRRSADRLLLLFGIWCVLYGIRMVAQQPAVHVALGGSVRTWQYFNAFVTYAINVPGGLFFEALIGPGLKQSIRRMWQLELIYAVGAIATDLLTHPNAAGGLNRPLVLVGLLVGVVNVVLYRRRLAPLFRTRMIVIAAVLLLFLVANENLDRPILPAVNLEPVGVFVFVTALGYGVVGSVVRSETEFLAVQRELATARRIQTALLPDQPPDVAGLDVAVRYVPMTAVAGDLYDFVALAPSRLGILVADVSGHGIPAALVASMVKLAFAMQTEQADDPAAVLTAMNGALSRQLQHAFVTAIYAVVDTERGTMRVANAGHPAAMIARGNGTIEEVDHHGLMLGFMADAVYTSAATHLDDGDVVFLYTDGVTEARNRAGEFFDRGNVRRWLDSKYTNAAGFSEQALRDLASWRGDTAFEDDVTFVVARFARR